MMRRLMAAILMAALPVALGCNDGSDSATGPTDGQVDALAGLEQQQISANEVLSGAFLEDLSEEDRAAVRAALADAREQIRSILDQVRAGDLPRDEARAQIDAVHDALVDTLTDFMTPEQIERLLKRRDRPTDRPDLDLTDEQLREIHALLQMFREFVREVRAQVEAGDLTPQEGRRMIRAKAQETREAICAVLTPSQQAKVPFCRGGPPHDVPPGPPGGSPPGQG